MILFINACVREESRTRRLAEVLLKRLGEYQEVYLPKVGLRPLDRATLEKRNRLVASADYTDEMFALSKQFASADTIVIAAPYWDLSFPALLKTYIENIYVVGLVSAYDENGGPVGLCRAKKLYYVTTAGGPYDETFSYGYLKKMAEQFFGIPETRLFKAEMLDVVGFDPEEILRKTEEEILAETEKK